jgi:UDP-N-acetylglucosamine--N-acetylmuramyl-(pentapeptide) pyrophosphoryl-undecaprenol N-acetylglucosamine transferase
VGLGGPGHQPQAETERLLVEAHGPGWSAGLAGLYRREVYLHDMAAAYSAADLVVCRAGAGAIHEISTLGRPALLVPKPNLPGDHQVQNARSLAGQGGAEILYEDLLLAQGRLTTGLDPDQLAQRILELLDDPDRLAALAGRAREFMDPEAAGRIADLVLGRGQPAEGQPPSPLLPPPPTHEGLLRLLGQAQQANPAAYDPGRLIPDHEELAYYRHRSALLLVHPDWSLRNVGVKLVGLLQDATKVDHLLHLLADRTPVRAWKRLLGGDFEQVGFIRRNVVTSLVLIDRHSPAVEAGLMTALADPYFEVRSAAAQAVAHFGQRLADRAAFEARLIARLHDKSFEVAREAALALGRVGRGEEAVAALLGLRLNHYWQVRQAALKALRELTVAGRVADPERLLQEITGFVVIATDFRPSFTIKESYQELVEAVRQAGQDQARPSGRSGEGA